MRAVASVQLIIYRVDLTDCPGNCRMQMQPFIDSTDQQTNTYTHRHKHMRIKSEYKRWEFIHLQHVLFVNTKTKQRICRAIMEHIYSNLTGHIAIYIYVYYGISK